MQQRSSESDEEAASRERAAIMSDNLLDDKNAEIADLKKEVNLLKKQVEYQEPSVSAHVSTALFAFTKTPYNHFSSSVFLLV